MKRGGGGGAYIQDGWPGSRGFESLFGVKVPEQLDALHTTKRCHFGERPARDSGLKPFGVAHGIGRREVKVVGDHTSASAPKEGRHVAYKDDRHVWTKLYTPAGINLFEKPCPRLWTT